MKGLALTKQKKIILLCLGIFAAAILIIVVVMVLGNGGIGAISASGDDVVSEHVSVGLTTPDPNDTSAQLQAILTRTTMLEGVTIGGINVGNMTIAEAQTAIAPAVQEKLDAFALTLTDGENAYPVTAEDLQLSCDVDAVIVAAYELAREDVGYDAVMAEVNSIRTGGRDFPVVLAADEHALSVFVADLAVELDVPATNASVTGGEKGISYTPEQNGVGIDQEALVTQIADALRNGVKTLAVPKKELPPTLTVEMLQTKFVLRGGYTTNFKNSSSNRKFNVRKAAGLVGGTVLAPGAVFSTNDTLGVRTLANGWKNAPAYIAGTHDDQPGGGVCQVSSTLYNAVVLSDLEIVFRRNHSMPVAYVKKGRDATINSIGNIIDFQFRNNTTDNIIIIAYTDGNELSIQIYGVPFATDEYDEIRIRTKQTSHTSYTTEIVEEDPNQDIGYEEILREGQDGYVVLAYKQYYKNGVMVREEELNRSTYKMFTEQKKVGIRATPEPTLEPTTEPTETPTAPPEPPTNPSEPPTNAPEPPTNAPEPPTNSPEPPTNAPESTSPEP